jgi:gamma-glutamylcyclotransferase (GGCT)/AIG2-like uncharacterized protein YtfP
MTQNDTCYLFVYGTLMSGARSELGAEQRQLLARDSDSLGPASLPHARLYDLGEYPGITLDGSLDDIVHGEAVLLSNPEQQLAWLDHYEGFTPGGTDNDYDRVVRQVHLAGGETFDAWVYVLLRTPDEDKRIVSGRWIGR